MLSGHWALHKGILVVLSLTSALLLGFALLPSASADVLGWNEFLKEIGFGDTQVYEVSDTVVIPQGQQLSPVFSVFCSGGDWMYAPGSLAATEIVSNPSVPLTDFNRNFIQDGGEFSRTIGMEGTVALSSLQLFDVEVTATNLCFSPSPISNLVGGEWQATDTVALLIGYSVLNLYWLAPVGIGIGIGIYLVRRRF